MRHRFVIADDLDLDFDLDHFEQRRGVLDHDDDSGGEVLHRGVERHRDVCRYRSRKRL